MVRLDRSVINNMGAETYIDNGKVDSKSMLHFLNIRFRSEGNERS